MKKISSVLALLLIMQLMSCSSDDDGINNGGGIIDLDSFTALNVGDNINLVLRYGANQEVELTGDGNLNKVDLFVDNDVLFVSDLSPDASNVVVIVESPDINSIVVENNGILNFDNAFETSFDELNIVGFDAAEIYNEYAMRVSILDVRLENAAKMALLDLDADELYVDLQDGSRCTLEGFATDQYISLINGCRLNLDFPYNEWEATNPIQGVNCTITADDGGNGWVQASNYLEATADNGTRIYYQGTPNQENFTELNGGEIVQKDN
ncbi:DUF2807 domain-containing protein [Tamlana sp. s12]|uniref:GIN domain-containing protein n=1 Tax=Tamlana sp. s12 TaxID=1630406 RepID=UPI00192ABE6D|nr:DUF2807 domain-containing protein [Tamlana sp. s12]QQY82296.1 DUF2807 domain-containing protein [Tamlana sp. s12]